MGYAFEERTFLQGHHRGIAETRSLFCENHGILEICSGSSVCPRNAHNLYPAVITSEIKETGSLEELLGTYLLRESQLDHIHLSALWMRFGQLLKIRSANLGHPVASWYTATRALH